MSHTMCADKDIPKNQQKSLFLLCNFFFRGGGGHHLCLTEGGQNNTQTDRRIIRLIDGISLEASVKHPYVVWCTFYWDYKFNPKNLRNFAHFDNIREKYINK